MFAGRPHGEHPSVEVRLDVAVAGIGGCECGQILKCFAPCQRPSLGVGPGEAPVEQRADRLLVALAEIRDKSTMRLFRRLLVVDRSGARDHKRARGQDGDGEGRDHEATHAMSPTGERGAIQRSRSLLRLIVLARLVRDVDQKLGVLAVLL
jgi:hypothetical protein